MRRAAYAGVVARYAIDPRTLVRLVDLGAHLDPAVRLVAPHSIRAQALELLWGDVLRGARTDHEALLAHERATSVPIRLLGDRVSRRTAWRLAREHGWVTLGHAEYVAIALLQADALVTVDADLARMAEGIVPLAPWEALGAQE